MNNAENRRWALVGPLAVALWIGGIALITNGQPGDHATGNDVLSWYGSHKNSILSGGWLFMLGCVGFVTFVAGLGRRLAAAAPLALAGAGIAAAFAMLMAAVDVAGALDKSDIIPSTAAAFHHSVDIFFIGAELAAILPIAALAVTAWRTRVLPRWWAGFSGLVAVVLLIGPIGWLGLIFGLPIWTLGTSLFVLLGSRTRMRAAAATA
jgi:hypothetical protein